MAECAGLAEFAKIENLNSYWLPCQDANYICAFFPKEPPAQEKLSSDDAYKSGGIFAFFKIGANSADLAAFSEKAAATFGAIAKISKAKNTFAWVNDEPQIWSVNYLTLSFAETASALISIPMGSYRLYAYLEEKPCQAVMKQGVLVFQSILTGKLYPPPESAVKNYAFDLNFIDLSVKERFGSLGFCFSCPGGGTHLKNLRVGMNFIYDKTAQAGKDLDKKPEIFSAVPVEEPKESFEMQCLLQPLNPLLTEGSYFKIKLYSETRFESGYSFCDGTKVGLRSSDLKFVFEKIENSLYLAPSGAVKILAAPGKASMAFLHDNGTKNNLSLMCGFKGNYSLGIDRDSSYLNFINAMPSYAVFDSSLNPPITFDTRSTTPWVAITQDESKNPEYYCHAYNMYEFEATGRKTPYTGYPTYELLSFDLKNSSFPLLPNTLRAAPDGAADSYEDFEAGAAAPIRESAVKHIGIKPSSQNRPCRLGKLFVNGSYAYVLSNEANTLSWLGIADGGNRPLLNDSPSLAFTEVTGDMLTAFTSPDPFIVMADPEAVLNCCSVAYLVTEGSMAKIEADWRISDKTKVKLKEFFQNNPALYNRKFDTETDFEAVLNLASPGISNYEMRAAGEHCDIFCLDQGEFKFSLHPRKWKNSRKDTCGRDDSILLFKYRTGISVKELIFDCSLWSFIAAAGNVAQTQKKIVSFIDTAEYEAARAKNLKLYSEYDEFLECVNDKDFTGILALNCPFVSEKMPSVINDYSYDPSAGNLWAKYLKITCALAVKSSDKDYRLQSDILALAVYENAKVIERTANNDFDFNINKISIKLYNHEVIMNRARGELGLFSLLGSSLNIFGGSERHSFEITGDRQNQGNIPIYHFFPAEAAYYCFAQAPIESLEITSLSLCPVHTPETTTLTINLKGLLRFKELDVDLFSYGKSATTQQDGYVEFSNLTLTKTINYQKQKISYSQDAKYLNFNLSNAIARENSWCARFPAKLKEFISYSENPSKIHPKALGYTAVQTPLAQSTLGDLWCALVWEVDLSTSGLLETAGIKLLVIMAWGINSGEKNEDSLLPPAAAYYVGIQLLTESGKRVNMEMSLFDSLKLSFKTIELKLHIRNKGVKEYSLHLRNFALSIFSLSIPSGYNTLSIYANPDQKDCVKLGWYAAYVK